MAEDDDTAPTGRAGADPLIAFPKESTGMTGQIARPGDNTPWWFIPALCAVAFFFIGLLATINQDRADDRSSAERQADEQDVAQAEIDAARPADTDDSKDATESESVDGLQSNAPDTSAVVDPLLPGLPSAGSASVSGVEVPIVSRCAVQLPYDPVDTSLQLSSYFFVDATGRRQLIDRTFDGETDRAQLLDGSESLKLVEIGDSGAFSATFATPEADDETAGSEFDIVVNPDVDAEQQCDDRLVTYAPGQFAEPHTRVILDVCIDRTTDDFSSIVGLSSDGGRFEILQPGGELGEIAFAERDGEVWRTAAPASMLRDENITSASGVVSNGVDDLNITIDIGNVIAETDAPECVEPDRL